MKILHTVQAYKPAAGGMAEAVRQISEGLVRRGHTVHVATEAHPDRQEKRPGGVLVHEFNVKGSMVNGFKGDLKPYQDFVLSGGYDVVVNFAAQQWATDALLPVLQDLSSRKVFVPTGFSGLYWPDYQEYFSRMPGWMRQYDLNIFLSSRYRDAEFAKAHGVENWTLIPNGADEEEFERNDLPDIRARLNIPRHHFLITHIGSHTGLKGHRDAIAIFSRSRIRDATFLLIGGRVNATCLTSCRRRRAVFHYNPRHWGNDKRFHLATLDRDQTVAALKAADLFLFPSQIECSPLVLFECLAAQTPFLTTDVGNAGEIVEKTGGGQVLPTRHFDNGLSRADVRQSVRCLETLWADPQRRALMAAQGHSAWRKRFTWEYIARLYEKAYAGLLNVAPGGYKGRA